MKSSDLKENLALAEKRLAELLVKRERLEIEIAKQKRTIGAWAELCEQSEIPDQPFDLDLGGLSDACRVVLRAAKKGSEWMTISQIQETLERVGFGLDDYKAPAASITTTVNRMVGNREVEPRKTSDGFNEYRWAGLTAAETFLETIEEQLRKGAEAIERSKRARASLGDVPNPFGKNLGEMLKVPDGKKKK